MAPYEKTVRTLLEQAGICIDGTSPWDIKVHHPGFYKRVITQGTLGLGESFMAGWWTCDAIDELFCKILTAELHNRSLISIPPYFNFCGTFSKVNTLELRFFLITTTLNDVEGNELSHTGNTEKKRTREDVDSK